MADAHAKPNTFAEYVSHTRPIANPGSDAEPDAGSDAFAAAEPVPGRLRPASGYRERSGLPEGIPGLPCGP